MKKINYSTIRWVMTACSDALFNGKLSDSDKVIYLKEREYRDLFSAMKSLTNDLYYAYEFEEKED